MNDWITRLFPDLSEFDIERCPKARGEVEKQDEPAQSGEVLNGVKWKTEFGENSLESERVVSSKPGNRISTLTGWDVAYLNEYHRNAFNGNPTWKQAMAEKLKSEWATVMEDGDYPSAERVVRNHTATGESEPQKGYGLSNVKKYFHAFNDAVRRELEEVQVKKGQK